MKIYLDMDGVCCHWMDSALYLVFKERKVENIRKAGEEAYAKWPEGDDPFGFNTDAFWNLVNSKGADWWANLAEFPHYAPMIRLLQRRGELVYLSSPPYGNVCSKAAAGKVLWLQHRERHGDKFRDFILTSRKELLAKTNTLLIDDSLKKCTAFSKAGGYAILFPQPWNGHQALPSHDVIAFLSACLEKARQRRAIGLSVMTTKNTTF